MGLYVFQSHRTFPKPSLDQEIGPHTIGLSMLNALKTGESDLLLYRTEVGLSNLEVAQQVA